MAGEPAETMVGVGAFGFGVLLLYSAYKNVSPFDLIRQAVTKGVLDPTSAGPLVNNDLGNVLHGSGHELSVQVAIDAIAKKDPTLAGEIKAQILTLTPQSKYADTKVFFDLMSQARVEGFASEVMVLEAYINSVVPASTTPSEGVHNV